MVHLGKPNGKMCKTKKMFFRTGGQAVVENCYRNSGEFELPSTNPNKKMGTQLAKLCYTKMSKTNGNWGLGQKTRPHTLLQKMKYKKHRTN